MNFDCHERAGARDGLCSFSYSGIMDSKSRFRTIIAKLVLLVSMHRNYTEFPYRFWPFANRAGVDTGTPKRVHCGQRNSHFAALFFVLFAVCGRARTALYRPSLTACITEPRHPRLGLSVTIAGVGAGRVAR
jgi:hypothetical protein